MIKNITIIDGHNLLNKIRDYKSIYKDNPEAAMISLYEKTKSIISQKSKLIMVYDGFSDLKKTGITFSGNQTADMVIRSFIEENYNKASITVVTSDNEIIRFAKVCGCNVIKSEDFFPTERKKKEIMEKYEEKPTGMSRKDFDFFKKSFK